MKTKKEYKNYSKKDKKNTKLSEPKWRERTV